MVLHPIPSRVKLVLKKAIITERRILILAGSESPMKLRALPEMLKIGAMKAILEEDFSESVLKW